MLTTYAKRRRRWSFGVALGALLHVAGLGGSALVEAGTNRSSRIDGRSKGSSFFRPGGANLRATTVKSRLKVPENHLLRFSSQIQPGQD